VAILKVSRYGLDHIINSLPNNIENTIISLYSLGDLKLFLLKSKDRGELRRDRVVLVVLRLNC